MSTTNSKQSKSAKGDAQPAQKTTNAKRKVAPEPTAAKEKSTEVSRDADSANQMIGEETTLLDLPAIGDSGDLGRSFSARLRELRRAKALSLRKLGREVGVTANAVLRWEKDEVTPTRGKMIELSRFFDVEPAWLAWGIGARRNRLKPADLVAQLEKCDETQLRAVSALLEAFDPESVAG
ncbi:MAG: helix-turn-helix transcriptional regulator [Pseudomonadales bacterium]|nr:helix-turn-helix transcriptional regulator [Pseudomonadales bacterium]